MHKSFKNPFTNVTLTCQVTPHSIIDFQAVLSSPFDSPFVILDGIAPASLIYRLVYTLLSRLHTFRGKTELYRASKSFETSKKSMKKELVNRFYWWIGTNCGKNCWMKVFVSLFYCFLGKALSSARNLCPKLWPKVDDLVDDRWRDPFQFRFNNDG